MKGEEEKRVGEAHDKQRPQYAVSMLGPPALKTLAGWCSEFHQSTENLTMGMLMKPTRATMRAIIAARVGSSMACQMAM